MAEKDQARIRELPSMDELNAKDAALDDLLSKLGGSISGRDLAPDESPQASTSGRTPNQMPPSRPPQALRAAAAASWKKSVQSADDQPGRLQSYIIREILKARTAAAAERKELDLEPYIRMYGADRTRLLALMEFCCLPDVGKVATFGHQYAFARAPAWWLREGVSGAVTVRPRHTRGCNEEGRLSSLDTRGWDGRGSLSFVQPPLSVIVSYQGPKWVLARRVIEDDGEETNPPDRPQASEDGANVQPGMEQASEVGADAQPGMEDVLQAFLASAARLLALCHHFAVTGDRYASNVKSPYLLYY
ncbi:hypothetical protein VOLCADRAFT_120969 [Volvox carteri f. nagariensis]|uniref:Uncharacterized protein n=1 Tax=Volvox carteri f. nagariensis TaxID=3068 RepID=D8TYK7_VOLCA|nr:uncharacterized protein VOLCADRAFT_120969 [Volvox carteri f. nagariensis]EFJ47412.1 hypothetical protein VOLCADRAFT_120969 [Volvox carteri f. nagariensis]|eukprot:XP_002951601.1 hypothetical protein VOLCADRAFT_120969 [Volvox carteri f. nagariensis]